ncbi:MAG: homocysteine S-methyltransferase family protein [Cellulosilyticaceae bacterium]
MIKPIFFDGAMGTALQAKGLKLGELAELYNFTHPELVKEVHQGYLQAGSNFITTNTFGCNPYRLSGTGYTPSEVIIQAVSLAKEVMRDFEGRFIALDIGSTGKLIEPVGVASFKEIYDIFKEQVVVAKDIGIDAIVLETFTELQELKAAILAVKENTNLPVFCTMSFEPNGYTYFGTSLKEMVELAESQGVDAFGINCGSGPCALVPVVRELVKLTKLPVIVQPNAGIPVIEKGCLKYNIMPREFANYMKQFADMGVRILGGCCGTDKVYIEEMIKLIKNK